VTAIAPSGGFASPVTVTPRLSQRLADADRLLIVRLSALGDVVHTLPLLDALRRARPHSHIVWVVEEGAASLLRDHPQIDRLLVFPRREIVGLLKRFRFGTAARLFKAFVRELRQEHVTLALDVQSNLRSSIVARLSGAPLRLGFGPGLGKEASHLLHTHNVRPQRCNMLKVERNLLLLAALGAKVREASAVLPVSAEAIAKAETFIAEARGNAGVVALHPGVSGFGSFKAWFPERWSELAQTLFERDGVRSVVTWGPGEEELAKQIVDRAGTQAAALAPATASLLELAALYQRADVVCGSDTGPVHLAAALGARVVGLYGPKDPAVYAPWSSLSGGPARVVRADVPCSPCGLRRCNLVVCMPSIGVEAVANAIREELGTMRSPQPSGENRP
jgi:lipopolysaccharide heptosyltransferase I